MKVTQTLELNEKERKIIQDFITLMDEIIETIPETIPKKSITNVAMYFCDNARYDDSAGYDDGEWSIDAIHQINEI